MFKYLRSDNEIHFESCNGILKYDWIHYGVDTAWTFSRDFRIQLLGVERGLKCWDFAEKWNLVSSNRVQLVCKAARPPETGPSRYRALIWSPKREKMMEFRSLERLQWFHSINENHKKCSSSKRKWSLVILFHQVVVLISTSKPQNMSSKLLLNYEIWSFYFLSSHFCDSGCFPIVIHSIKSSIFVSFGRTNPRPILRISGFH